MKGTWPEKPNPTEDTMGKKKLPVADEMLASGLRKFDDADTREQLKPRAPFITVSFDELVQHGIDSGAPLTRGMPWSFNFIGHPVTHENDDLYLIGAGAKYRLARGESIDLPIVDCVPDPVTADDDRDIGLDGAPLRETYMPEYEPETPEFAEVANLPCGCPSTGPCLGHVAEMAASEIPAPVDIEQFDDEIDSQIVDEDNRPVTARELGEHFEKAPSHVQLPENFLPPGTDIHVEVKGQFVFKLPGQAPLVGRGRTIYGAMVNAGILK